MTARRLFLFAFAAALAAGLGCSNDPATTGPALLCTDGGNAAANGVNTNCGGALDSVTEQVDIVMNGSGGTLMGLNFDVTYDPTKLTFVPAATYTSPLFPQALVPVTSVTAGRVIVSIQRTGDLGPVTVPPGQNLVLSLVFTRAAGATFPLTPIGLENYDATSPSPPVLITFASGTAIAYQ